MLLASAVTTSTRFVRQPSTPGRVTFSVVDAERLEAIPLFAGLPPGELAAIGEVVSEVELAAGTSIADEGAFGHALYAIEAGSAEVSRNGDRVRTLGPGDVFGEIAVLASGRRTASIVITEPVRALAIFKRDVWALEQTAPAVSRRLRELVAEHLD
jgi:CPA1 family monovalent cation:H+ antiporter